MAYNDKREAVLKPKVHDSVFVAQGAHIYGDVEIGEGSSVWFNAVIRGDEGKVTIGKNTNIQDNAVVHSDDGAEVEIGDNVTIGHGAVMRGGKIGNNVMVGMNATVMSNSEIGENSIVGGNSFVPYFKKFPKASILAGAPAKLIREAGEKDMEAARLAPRIYSDLIRRYSEKKIVGYEKK
jgi:carbonic anhydrase/acetyltransferase-like protein (isoleucine patch superfamily)